MSKVILVPDIRLNSNANGARDIRPAAWLPKNKRRRTADKHRDGASQETVQQEPCHVHSLEPDLHHRLVLASLAAVDAHEI